MSEQRVVSWYSHGAASAVATKLAIAEYNTVDIVNCEVIEEHPDNKRFLSECEKWFGQKIKILGNDKYNRSIYQVFEKERYLAGVYGAKCTTVLKKQIRKEYQRHDDIQVMGFTVDEQSRANRFIDANNDVELITPLIDHGLTKNDCFAILSEAGIELPAMYHLGYKNNNCRGCVKSESPAYWQKIKIDFPEYYSAMSAQEKRLGVKICKMTVNGKSERISLEDIPETVKPIDDSPDIQCGIFCELASQTIRGAR